jgi:uncharacterized delta-60 repeat protein
MKNNNIFLCLLLSLSAQSFAQPAGALDLSFGTAGKTTTSFGPNNESAHAMAVQADGKIVVAGGTYNNNSVLDDFALARYNTDGTLDATFGSNGLVVTDLQQATDVVNAIAIQPDGKILAAGYSDNTFNYDFAVARYLPNGTLDNSFGTNGKVIKNFGSTDFGLAMALLPNGKIVVAGRAYNGQNGDFALVQLNPNGSFDNSFGTAGAVLANLFGEDESANAIAIQSDGKIVLAGDRYANNVSVFAAARFNSDGSLDPSFSGDGKQSTAIGTLSDVAYAVAIQTDGKIVLAGQSNTAAVSDFALVRYLSDGSLDASFSGDGMLTTSPSNGGDYAYSVAIQADGKILAGGWAAGSNSISDFTLVRYLSDGSLDAGFGNNGIVVTDFDTGNDKAYAMVLHQGKILLAGSSDKNSQTAFALARFVGGGSVGAQDLTSESLQISPNPASETVLLTIPSSSSGMVRIFDATGQLMTEIPIEAGQSQLHVSTWPRGLYFVQYSENGKILGIEKLVLSRD